MKKSLLILTSLFLLSACGQKSDDDVVAPTTPPTEETPSVDEPVVPVEPDHEKAMIDDKITVDTPKINDEIVSPVTVRGEARGTWFFEGSFPVVLLDQDDKELARGNATSTESWMTEEFIPFEAKLDFDPGKSTSGTIVIEKENPSGLPENAGKLEIPVTF